jgi:hypothetical protein
LVALAVAFHFDSGFFGWWIGSWMPGLESGFDGLIYHILVVCWSFHSLYFTCGDKLHPSLAI